MSALRRVVFVLGLLPVLIYAFGKWIITGQDALKTIDRYVEWGAQ